MDVRCEKCFTVYEFDDAQIGAGGVTVKCTQCGNLFKVKKLGPSGADGGAERSGKNQADVPAADEWMIRLASSGEVFRFREMTTLQSWIVERKVGKDDEISRDGKTWKPLRGVNELKSHFKLVERVEEEQEPPTDVDPLRAQQWKPAESVPLELSTTAPMTQPPELSGPNQMGYVAGDGAAGEDPAFASTTPKRKLTPASMSIPPVVDDLADLDLPARPSRGPIMTLLLFLIIGGGIGYVAVFRKDLVRGLVSGSGGRGDKAYAEGREKFLLDSDDGFRKATALFERAHGADETNALALAAIAEAQATWAWYLREDAHALDAGGAADEAAAKSLRKEAQNHLDDAKRYASDALALGPDATGVNRAMSDFLRVDGAPSAEAERYLKRALDKDPNDAEALYVAGALLHREGKLDEARAKLELANQQKPLLRASYLLARIAVASGQKDTARAHLATILRSNPEHERARALLATLDAASAPVDAAAAAKTPDLAPAPAANGTTPRPNPNPNATPKTPPKTPGEPPRPAPSPGGALKGEDVPGKPGNYNSLVSQGDRLSENGRTDQARKLYEKALVLQPGGVEAVTGLAYCDLDREKFSSAVDRFKQALKVSPDYGEALIGLAEVYKIRGEKPQAADFYRRYLKSQPHGPKAAMAQKNLKDLEPKQPAPERQPEEPPRAESPLPKPPLPSEDTPPPP